VSLSCPLEAHRHGATSRRKKTEPEAPRPRRWASRQATAEHLGVSERTVTYTASDGRITAYRLGRTTRFDLNEIDAAMRPSGWSIQ
jgi:excisionase family DNA binding protein